MTDEVNPLISIVRKYGMVSRSNWALARGLPSKYFFDIDKGAYAPEASLVISNLYAERIRKLKSADPRIDRLVFIEKAFGTIGTISFLSSIVTQTGIDATIIRLRKEISLVSQKGATLTDQNCAVILSDVLTSGESVERVAQMVRKHGAEARYAVVLYDREQGGKERLEQSGIRVETLSTRAQLAETGDVPREPEVRFSPEDEVIAPPQTIIEEFERALSSESRDILKSVYIK